MTGKQLEEMREMLEEAQEEGRDLERRRDCLARLGEDVSELDQDIRLMWRYLDKSRRCLEKAERYDFAAEVLEGIENLRVSE